MRRSAKFDGGYYVTIAQAISQFEDAALRRAVTSHFVDFFNARSRVFDAARFKDACQPRTISVPPKKTATASTARQDAYKKPITLPKVFTKGDRDGDS